MTDQTPTVQDLFHRWQYARGTQSAEQLCHDYPHLVSALLNLIAQSDPAISDNTVTQSFPDQIAQPPTFATPRLPAIEGYTLIKKIAEGGQGAVYQALQQSPRRKVAIKVLLQSPYSSKSVRHRFEREVELVATLRHPHIVAVFDSGTTADGHLYYAMDYVHGIPFTDFVRTHKLPLEKTLELFATACEAVNHAHQKGVMHRDLKPSNILVTDEGHLQVLDFGLAKQIAEPAQTQMSMTGQIMGTLPYMSPEQTKGNPDLLDIRTDVYALGVILYELLTGAFPYPVAGAMAEVLQHIANTTPKPLTKSWTEAIGVANSTSRRKTGRCPIDDEVETIALKALSKERERRYQSAGELGRDIQHYLKDEPIEAKRDSGMYLLKRTLSKYRLAASVATLFILLLAISTVVFWVLRNQAAAAAARERDARGKAEAAVTQIARERDHTRDALRAAADRFVVSLSYESGIQIDQGRPDKARHALYQGLDLLGETSLSPLWITAPLLDLNNRYSPPLCPATAFSAHTGPVYSVALSPDGRTALSASADKTLKLWDIAAAREIRAFVGHTGDVRAVAFAPDGRTALSASADKTLKLWDVATGKEIRTFVGHTGTVAGVAFSPDGHTALSGSVDKTLKLWDVATGNEIRTFIGHTGTVAGVAFSPDGHTALSGSIDKTLKLWDIATGNAIRTCAGHTGAVASVAFSPDGRTALSGSVDKTLKLWDIATGNEISTFTGHTDQVLSVAFSSDGRRALSGSVDKTLSLWDIATATEIHTFGGHTNSVWSVAFSPDGRTALSGSWDKSLKLWNIATNNEIPTFHGYDSFVHGVAFSPNGGTAISGNFHNSLKLWDIATGSVLRTFAGHTGPVYNVAFSPDGRTVLSASADKTARLWDVATGKEIRTFAGHTDYVFNVTFAPDGRTAVSTSKDNTFKLWDIATGNEIRSFTGHAGWVCDVVFSHDGRTLLSASADKTLKLWDIATGNVIRTFTGHTNVIRLVAFSPDGRTALSASDDRTLKLWDIATADEIRTFTGHAGPVLGIAFAPDGRTALSASNDETLKLWDIVTAKEILTFTGHAGPVYSVAFAPDGNSILSAGDDGTLKLWDFSRSEQYRRFEVLLSSAYAARAINLEDPAALLTFGQYYAFRGIDDWAADCLERARKGGSPISPLLLGQCYWRLNRYAEALAQYQKARDLKEAPDSYLDLCIDAIPRTDAAALHAQTLSQWRLDSAYTDSSGNARTLTPVANPAFGTGRLDRALSLNGIDQYAMVTPSVLTTNQPFSVSAWVYWDGDTGYNTAVSQDGASVSAFYLQFRGDTQQFSFTMLRSDFPEAATPQAAVKAQSTTNPTANTWYHLIGVYNGTQIKLYVNGAPVATTAFSTPFAAAGSTVVGAAKYNGARVDHWHGAINRVQLFSGALTDTEVLRLYNTTLPDATKAPSTRDSQNEPRN